MNKTATVIIELNYDLEGLRFMTGEDISEEDFEKVVQEYALHDLTALMQTDNIDTWSVIEIEDME